MKALILAAGKGTRLRPLTWTWPKQLLPLMGRPIIFYIIEQVVKAGINDIGLVVSPQREDRFRQVVGDGTKWGVKISYILQPKPLGIAHAVKLAHKFIASSPFLLFLGDNLIEGDVTPFVLEFEHHHPDAFVLLKEVIDARSFGIAQLSSSGRIICVEEKPRQPKSNLALVGVYLFSPVIWEAIAQIKPSWRGELEITDAIQKLIDEGKEVRSYILKENWLDIGRKEDLLRANSTILKNSLKRNIQVEVDSENRIVGEVEIGKGTVIKNSILQGPVFVGGDCQIIDSNLGPEVSLGERSKIESSSVECSIIMEDCYISQMRLRNSILGRKIKLAKTHHNTAHFFLADNCEVELG
jgi:glucose-1-phosphate thymidylyltransferase